MWRAPPFDDDHRPVVEEADALAGLLALLDDPDVQLLAGQHGGLDRVGQRVDVHDPDALELGDAVEVEVVGQDHPAARQRQRDELGVDLGDLGHVVLDDLDRGPGLLLHPVEDLQPAPATVAAQRIGAVGDVLELLEDEARDDERPVDEARFDDLGDPPVDDRARVDHDVGIAPAGRCRGFGILPPDDADRLGRQQQVGALGDRQPEHPEAEQERDAERQPGAERRIEVRQRQPEQEPHQQPDQEAQDGRHELGGGEILDAADDPDGGHDRQVRQDREPDDDPGHDPGCQEGAGVGHVAEQLAPIDLDRRECEADQAAEGGPKDPDIADQRFPRRARRPRTTIGTGGRSA